MAEFRICVKTTFTYDQISTANVSDMRPRPLYLDNSSFSSAYSLSGFENFGWLGTGTPSSTTAIYAVWYVNNSNISTSNITSCWLTESSTHKSSPSSYSNLTYVWTNPSTTTQTLTLRPGGTSGGSDYTVSAYNFGDAEAVGTSGNNNVWQHYNSGNIDYYHIDVTSNSLWVRADFTISNHYIYTINIIGTGRGTYDGVAILTAPRTPSSSDTMNTIAAWSECVIAASGTYAKNITYNPTSSGTLYIYFRSTTAVAGEHSDVAIERISSKTDPGFELSGDTTTTPTTAYIRGRAVTTGTIKWGNSSSSMTGSVAVNSANTWVNITSQTSVGSKTIYAEFIPSNLTSYYMSDTETATATVNNIQNITVSIGANGGSGGTSSVSVVPGASSWSISNVPSRTGFQLTGFWDTSDYSGGTQYLNATGSSVHSAPTSSTTIYARWSPIINYATTSSSYTVYCTTSNHEASTTEGNQQITISSGGTTSSGLTILYKENNENWTVSSDGKKLTIPNGLSPGTYELEIEAYINASNTTHNIKSYDDYQITVTILAVTKYPNNTSPQKYKNTSGTTGYNVTYETPTASISSSLTAADGTFYVTCSVTNSTNWYWKYTNDTYSSNQTGSETGTARWRITSNGNSRFSSPTSGGSSLTIGGTSYTTYPSGSSYKGSHSTMGKNATTDTVGITAYNIGDTSKNSGEKTASVTNSTSTSTSTEYGTPTVEIGSGIDASGGNATVTCTVTNTVTTTTTYTSGATSSSDSTVEGTARWKITSNGNNRFSHPSSGGVSLSGVGTVYNSGTKVYHDDMTNNPTTDTVVVTAYNIGSTSKTATAEDNTVNSLDWEKPVITRTSTVNMPAAGGSVSGPSYATATQTQQYTSGTVVQTVTVPNSAITYAVYVSKTWATLTTSGSENGTVTFTNNTTTSARDGFRVSISATYNSRTSSTVYSTFNQPAGSQGNLTPVITGYTYSTAAAAGVTNSAPTVTYRQEQNAWNGVAGSGTVVSNTGGTLAYTTTGTLPSGFSTGNNFSTTGNITWDNNESTSTKDAKSNLKVTVTVGSLSSSAYTCTACSQSAGAIVYETPTVSNYKYSTNVSAAGTTDLGPATLSYSQAWTWNGVSGSGGNITTGGTLAFTRKTTYSWMTEGTNFATTGKINVASRGTTIGNLRNFYSALSVTVTLNGKTSSSTTATVGRQVANYVTAIEPKDSSGGTGSHFSYANIGPGDTSASPTMSGGATYTFTSGSTMFSSSGSPSFGGTASYSRTYSLGAVQNGFRSVNSSTGVLTATSMGTNVLSARTSGTVTSVLTVTYTHESSYSSGGTVTSSTKSSTATCTQNANAVTGLTLTVGANPINYHGTTSATVTATYTSGANKNVSTEASYSTDPSDIVNIETLRISVDDFDPNEDLQDWIYTYCYPNSISDTYAYTGQTITYNNTTRYLWKQVGGEMNNEVMYLLTSTIDFNTLRQSSLDYDANNINTYPVVILDNDMDTYVTSGRCIVCVWRE